MAGKSARTTVVQVATASTGTYSTVVRLNNASFSIDGGTIDVTDFADTYRDRIIGIRDATWTLSGFFASSDTNGQTRIRSSLTNDSNLFIKYLFTSTGSTGYKQQVRVASIDYGAAVDGAQEITFNLEGAGALAATTS